MTQKEFEDRTDLAIKKDIILSRYKIWWIEFEPEKGKATKCDCNRIDGWDADYHIADVNTGCYYKYFSSKEKAIEFLQNFKKKLTKKYNCRLFTDKQFGMRKRENNYKVPFTTKQLSQVYIIG